MTYTLNQLVQSLLDVNNWEDTEQRQVMRLISPVLTTGMTFVISSTEPHDEPLPANVVWLDMNKTSASYRKLRQRVSKTPSTGLFNTWKDITKLDQAYSAQQYDPTDLPNSTLKVATNNEHGIAQLTTAPKDYGRPVFVSTDDPRNFDARDPLPHEHPEKPARELATQGTAVNIVSRPQMRGQTLVAKDNVSAEYDKLDAQVLKETNDDSND